MKKNLPVLFLSSLPFLFPSFSYAQDNGCYVRVNWGQIDNFDDDFVSYYLYRRENGDSYGETPIATINNISETTYEDTSIQDGSVYHYAVRSVDDVGNISDYSSDATIKVICENVGSTPVGQAVVDLAQTAVNVPGGEATTALVINGATLVNNTGVSAPMAMAGAGVGAAAAQAPALVFNLPTFLLGYVKKRKNKWGVVYNSKTKLPIASALVILTDTTGNIKTDITDAMGRFDFTVKAGRYGLQVRVNNFKFPSKKITAKEDDIYSDVYLGEEIEIEQQAVNVNIPLDPTGMTEESANAKSAYLKEKILLVFSKVTKLLFWLGLSWSLLSLLLAPSLFKLVVFFLYFAVIAFMQIRKFRNRLGKVTDQHNRPVSKAIVRLISSTGEVADTAYTDKNGRYSFLVDPGKYQLSVDIVDIKDPTQTYKNMYKSKIKTIDKQSVVRDKITIER